MYGAIYYEKQGPKMDCSARYFYDVKDEFQFPIQVEYLFLAGSGYCYAS